MNIVLTDIGLVIGAFAAMECVAWFTHKYIMHGLLWSLHRDHHKKETRGFFERNDFFFMIFGIPGITAMFFGALSYYNYIFWIGLGISLYGFAYFFVHDIFIHQRFTLLRRIDNAYFKAIRRAHKMHHKHLDKQDGECFGMLWVPFKYFAERKKKALQ